MTTHSTTTSTTTTRRRARKLGGFTLVEILVVIGIMVAIAAIAIPMINRARIVGIKTRVAADLQAIGVALDAYKNDFGDYPRFTADNDDPALAGPAKKFINGAEMLCLALIGPRSKDGIDTFPPGHASDTFDGDGADGPGFRTSVPPSDAASADLAKRRMPRVYGPYMDPAKFKLADPAAMTTTPDLKLHEPKNLVMLSYYDTPILYFPSRAQKASINAPSGYVALLPASPVPLDHPIRGSMWDARYGVRFFRHGGEANDNESIKRFRVMLGDTNFDGDIDPASETADHEGGYALWATGPDDKFGPDDLPPTVTSPSAFKQVEEAVQKCDDVVNFR